MRSREESDIPFEETLHGQAIRDPYRWLESDGPATREWIERQQRLTRGFLAQLPARSHLEQRLEALMDYPRYGVPQRRRGRWVFTRNDGLQNQPVVYTSEGWEGSPRLLLDPNDLSADGTRSLSGFELSPDARLLAYGVSDGGSDWQQWRVRDVATGADLPDVIRWVKFSGVAWTADGQGFFYCRFDPPPNQIDRIDQTDGIGPAEQVLASEANRSMKVCYHRLGTDSEADRVVYANPDRPDWGYAAEVTDDGRYLLIQVWCGNSSHRGLLVSELSSVDLEDWAAGNRPLPMIELPGFFEARWDSVAQEGSRLWFETDLEAPRGRILAIDLDDPSVRRGSTGAWTEIVPEREETLQRAVRVGDRLLVHYLRSASSTLYRFDLFGGDREEVELPALSTAAELRGSRNERDAFFILTSFTQPPTLYRYDLDEHRCRPVQVPPLAYDPESFVTRQRTVTSPDGTRLTVFLSHRRDLEPGPDTPVLLYGYGGFNVSVTPQFASAHLLFMELGGLFVAANIRGGGEYGEGWHRAGTRRTKQRTFDDFQAVARWLVDEGLTRPSRLAITGSSNGGLLAGACLTQRPELFGAVVVRMGVLDMLRFHKFTIGWAWESDYGSPEDPEDFQVLLAYSPYHNVRPGTAYPPTLVVTADHDDRVVPLHSFKFAAALQEAQAADAPVLLRVETRAGHGAGTSVRKRIEQATDELTFIAEALGMEIPAGDSHFDDLPASLQAGDGVSEAVQPGAVWPRRRD